MKLEQAVKLLKECAPESDATISLGLGGARITVAEALAEHWVLKKEITDPEMIKLCREAHRLLKNEFHGGEE
jgi:hypothetical protein